MRKTTNNTNLRNAKARIDNEFYTWYEDIEAEIKHYKKYLVEKVVYCNCDDPKQSNFYKYFKNNFKMLGLKKVIFTFLSRNGNAFKTVLTASKEEKEPLFFNGDFNTSECLNILLGADVVITNPPFSLQARHTAQAVENGKDFITIGSVNNITNKLIDNYLVEKKLNFGFNYKALSYLRPNGSIKKIGCSYWFTSLHIKRHDDYNFNKKYVVGEYKCYDRTDIINVDRICDIPYDYYRPMGVPITYLVHHNPSKFEIIGIRKKPYVRGKAIYTRLLIERKKQNENN